MSQGSPSSLQNDLMRLAPVVPPQRGRRGDACSAAREASGCTRREQRLQRAGDPSNHSSGDCPRDESDPRD